MISAVQDLPSYKVMQALQHPPSGRTSLEQSVVASAAAAAAAGLTAGAGAQGI